MKIPTPRPTRTAGEKAALFCLFVPLVMLALNWALGRHLRDAPSLAGAFLAFEGAMLIAALGVGLYALGSMRRFGREGILAKSIVGVLLNAVFLAAFVAVIVPLREAGKLRDRMAGEWTRVAAPTTAPTTSPTAAPSTLPVERSITLSLGRDGAARVRIVDGPTTRAAFAGRWQVDGRKLLSLDVTQVDAGDPAAAGKRLGLGIVSSLDESHLTLRTDAGDERYGRAP